MTPELTDRLLRLPTQPGVYLMRGPQQSVLYVGKATNLRSRVRSYFAGNDPRAFVRHLDGLLTDVEVFVTSNAKEALLLENTLIKKHRPRFNVMLRDDKNYLSLRIRRDQAWPRVELVRQIRSDGALYFGPYHSAQSVRQTLTLLNRYFHLRTCPDHVLNNRQRPCLQYQIRRCPAPCVLPVDREAYLDDVDHAVLFLQRRQDELVPRLERAMLAASEDLAFELAGRYRDQLQAVQASLTTQDAVQTRAVDQDVVAIYREGEAIAVAVMEFRGGRLADIATWGFFDQLLEDDVWLEGFLTQYYATGRIPPAEVLTSVQISDAGDMRDALSELRGSRVKLLTPQRGERTRVIALAQQNAQRHFDEALSHRARAIEAVEKLARRLGLRQAPRVMECFDISNFQGTHVVASQVVFVDGVADRSRYRRYRIRTVVGQDDFASMYEVLARRARRAREGGDPLPDLIVIDGGRGQLQKAIEALTDLRMQDEVEIASLAKSRVKGVDAEDTPERSPERVFLPGRKEPVVLPQTSDENLLLERIRDEAHRFAITYHRELRSRATLRSRLDDIPGVGETRRTALLRQFGSVKKVAAASLTALEATPGLGRTSAARVFAFFHPDAIDRPAPDDIHAVDSAESGPFELDDVAVDLAFADDTSAGYQGDEHLLGEDFKADAFDDDDQDLDWGTLDDPVGETSPRGAPLAAANARQAMPPGVTRVVRAGSKRPRR